MAACQHDIKLETLFKEEHVKLLKQKLFTAVASKPLPQFFVYGWRLLRIYTSKKLKILIIVRCAMKTKEVASLSSWQNIIGTTNVCLANFMRRIFPYYPFNTLLLVLGVLNGQKNGGFESPNPVCNQPNGIQEAVYLRHQFQQT